MVDFEKFKQDYDKKGIVFTASQFAFAIELALGVDKYQAYITTIASSKYDSLANNEDKRKLVEQSKKDCDFLVKDSSIQMLVEDIKQRYIADIQTKALSLDDVELTSDDVKKIITKLLKQKYDNLEQSATKDIIDLIKTYLNNFTTSDELDDRFGKHFIQIYPHFNGVCPYCNHEIDAPMGVTFKCPNCGRWITWDEEKERYIY